MASQSGYFPVYLHDWTLLSIDGILLNSVQNFYVPTSSGNQNYTKTTHTHTLNIIISLMPNCISLILDCMFTSFLALFLAKVFLFPIFIFKSLDKAKHLNCSLICQINLSSMAFHRNACLPLNTKIKLSMKDRINSQSNKQSRMDDGKCNSMSSLFNLCTQWNAEKEIVSIVFWLHCVLHCFWVQNTSQCAPSYHTKSHRIQIYSEILHRLQWMERESALNDEKKTMENMCENG